MGVLTESDLAYVAGVVDVLANLRLRQPTATLRSPLPEVQVNGPYPGLQSYLGRITGTRPVATRRDYTRHNCTEHCPDRHAHIVSESGRWGVTGTKAFVLLSAVRPHLRLRAGLVDDLIAAGAEAQHKTATLESMSRLGWPLPERISP